jgi:hypothetical protein
MKMMMFKKKFSRLSIVMIGAAFVFASLGEAAPPGDTLQDLRKSFFVRQEKLLYHYLEQLVQLETSILVGDNPRDSVDVKAEISRIEREIKKIPAAPQAVAASIPAPRPVIKKRDPETHVSQLEGLAGAAKFSKNNVYTFHLESVGKTSTLKFWATGRRSIDSVGYVWLITPDGRRERVTKWKEQYFDKPATELSSYKNIEPFIEDVSDLVTRAGAYKIEFEWTGGVDPLVIFRVELIS